MTTADFEVFDAKQTAENPILNPSKAPDTTWVERLAPLPVGYSFRVKRPDTESVRNFVKRVNNAARSEGGGFKSLEWHQENPNLPREQEHTFLVRVKALDVKAQQRAQALSQNGTSQAQQPTQPQETSNSTPEQESGPRGPRGR